MLTQMGKFSKGKEKEWSTINVMNQKDSLMQIYSLGRNNAIIFLILLNKEIQIMIFFKKTIFDHL